MPGDHGAAEPARYALLGLLLSDRSHGYDLARQFADGSALGEIIHLSPSHLYALLGRLERDGLIAGEVQEAGNRPTRRMYQLTNAGHELVMQWIDEPVGHPRDMRIEFPLKLYMACLCRPPRGAQLVERQRERFSAYIRQVEELPVQAESEGDAAFVAAVRAGRIGRAQAAIDWLDRSVAPLVSD
jgi:DNA-binding PadR family transcriptional regulator